MPTIIRYLQLPFRFETTQLATECDNADKYWQLHYNTYNYTGNWSAIPLRSPGGNPGISFAETMGIAGFEDTLILDELPGFRKILAAFPFQLLSARLLKLARGAVIKEHRDIDLAYEEGEIRLHIPIITHPEVEFWLDGDRLQMSEGECWYINANLPHHLSNPSPVDRIHLVVDALVDEKVKKLFDNVPDTHKSLKEVNKHAYLAETIKSLMESPDPQMQEWAKKLMAETPQSSRHYTEE